MSHPDAASAPHRPADRSPGPAGPLTVTPLTSHLGARVTGVDFSRQVEAETFGRVYRAYLDWHVLSIPEQSLEPAQVVALSEGFGPVEPHVKTEFHHPETSLLLVLSNRVVDGKPLGARDGGTFWHSDVSYRDRPARATLLYAIEVPDEGGDTLFTDMTRAYEELPRAMKRRLEGLRAIHDYTKADEINAAQGGKRQPLSEAEKAKVPPVPHPVVRTHPETGRKAIYVNPAYTRRIVDMPQSESDALLDELFAHCLQPAYRLTYHWSTGDVVVWDNAAVMHSATTLHLDPAKHRTLWRTVITGDVPH